MLGLFLTTGTGTHALAQADSGEIRGRVENTYRSPVALVPITWCRPDGTALTPLPTPHGVYQPAWAPDGSKLAGRYLPTRDAGSGGGSFIITVNPDGTGAIVMSGPADHSPAWGP